MKREGLGDWQQALGRGRPRSPRADEDIRKAAFALLAERGYSGATIGAVAERAGAGTKTIYRRYSNREDMLADAIEHEIAVGEVNFTGNALLDLRGILDLMSKSLALGVAMRVFATCLVEEPHHPELIGAFRRSAMWPRERILRAVIERGIRNGVVRKGVDVDVVVCAVQGAIMARYGSGRQLTDDFATGIVKMVFEGILRHDGHSEARVNYDMLR